MKEECLSSVQPQTETRNCSLRTQKCMSVMVIANLMQDDVGFSNMRLPQHPIDVAILYSCLDHKRRHLACSTQNSCQVSNYLALVIFGRKFLSLFTIFMARHAYNYIFFAEFLEAIRQFCWLHCHGYIVIGGFRTARFPRQVTSAATRFHKQ